MRSFVQHSQSNGQFTCLPLTVILDGESNSHEVVGAGNKPIDKSCDQQVIDENFDANMQVYQVLSNILLYHLAPPPLFLEYTLTL